MNDPANSSDEELLDSVSATDDHAVAALAGRYSQALYDFALRTTLDPAYSAALTREAFVYLRNHAADRPSNTSVRAWLFGLAMEQMLTDADDRSRDGDTKVSAGDRRFTQTDADVDREVAVWAWQAARNLRRRDYCLLDLTLRRGISPEELPESVGQGRGGIYGVIGRARGAFDESYLATALYFRGREACETLADLVGRSRRQIAEHLEECSVCQATLNSVPGAADVFESLRLVDLPPDLPAQILAGVAAAVPAAQLSLQDALAGAIEGEEEVAEPTFTEENMFSPAGDDVFIPSQHAGDESEATSGAYPDEGDEIPPAPALDLPERLGREPAPRRVHRPATARAGIAGSLLWSYVLLGVSTAVAIYLGIAVADSLRGGGGNGGEVSLGSASALRDIPCEAGPLTLAHGTTQTFRFDPAALDGFEIDSVSVRAESRAGQDPVALTARVERPSSLQLQASRGQAQTPRQDVFLVQIQWKRGSETALSDCAVQVNVAS
jgi:DNA-directed RNA polymerase specialized sigma24 family protein